jgi:hypothetical protein
VGGDPRRRPRYDFRAHLCDRETAPTDRDAKPRLGRPIGIITVDDVLELIAPPPGRGFNIFGGS